MLHVEGAPLNYGTIQLNYREAQRKSGVPYTGTHILRHGMAKLARKVGGGLDAVMAHIRSIQGEKSQSFENVISLIDLKRAKNL